MIRRFAPLVVAIVLGAGCASPSVVSVKSDLPCTQEATQDESGAVRYPIASEYERLPNLGQIFTALDCGNLERAQRVHGMKDGLYVSGITLSWGDSEPPPELRSALEKHSFANVSHGVWRVTEPLTIEQLNELRPFFTDAAQRGALEYEDCVVCG